MKKLAMSLIAAGVLASSAALAETPLYAVTDGSDVAATEGAIEKPTDTRLNAAAGLTAGDRLATNAATIDTLPRKGTVQLQGTVSSIDDDSEFTLSDGTGEIDVELKSETALIVGDKVSVIGEVDRFFGFKSIEDAEVSVMAGADAAY